MTEQETPAEEPVVPPEQEEPDTAPTEAPVAEPSPTPEPPFDGDEQSRQDVFKKHAGQTTPE